MHTQILNMIMYTYMTIYTCIYNVFLSLSTYTHTHDLHEENYKTLMQ
jgi:hypothetical protein